MKSVFANIKKYRRALSYSKSLTDFNKESNNNIQSVDVSLNAIKGHDISVLKGTYICNKSEIQSYSYIGFNSLISKSKIGRYSSIASNVNIGHGEHPIHTISTNSLFLKSPYETLTKAECIIENDVWIGVASIIKRGVHVGTGSVVGANSFVNKDVPPYAIVVGSPAKILRYRFDDNLVKILLDSRWWEKEFDEANKIINELEKKYL